MNRREFLAALAVARSLPASAATATTSPNSNHGLSPYAAALRKIDPDGDDFACEKAAKLIEGQFARLLTTRSLPLAPDFHGISPHPVRYSALAEHVERAEFDTSDTRFLQGLREWIDSLGHVRTANFYALPNDRLRYEIAGQSEYRVGIWNQVWIDGKLSSFRPVEETRMRVEKPLFRDITASLVSEHAVFPGPISQGQHLVALPAGCYGRHRCLWKPGHRGG